MIIVSGRISVRPEARQAFVTASAQAVALARRTPGCRDFVVAADPLEPDRVNVYEEWESEQALLAFRGDGPERFPYACSAHTSAEPSRACGIVATT